jgi:hypothetical protein
MARDHILVDGGEIVLSFFVGKNFRTLNLHYDQVVRIQFNKCKEFRFFRFVPSEEIQVVTNKVSTPIVYRKYKELKFFEKYKQELEKFAKDNHVTFANNL